MVLSAFTSGVAIIGFLAAKLAFALAWWMEEREDSWPFRGRQP